MTIRLFELDGLSDPEIRELLGLWDYEDVSAAADHINTCRSAYLHTGYPQ